MSVTTKSELGFANDPCSQNGRYKITATIVVLCKRFQSHFLKHKNGTKPATKPPPPTMVFPHRIVHQPGPASKTDNRDTTKGERKETAHVPGSQ